MSTCQLSHDIFEEGCTNPPKKIPLFIYGQLSLQFYFYEKSLCYMDFKNTQHIILSFSVANSDFSEINVCIYILISQVKRGVFVKRYCNLSKLKFLSL